VLSSICPFEFIQNRRSTAIAEQYYVYLSTASCGREELNDSLSVCACIRSSVSGRLRRSFGPELAPKTFSFPILAGSSRSRGAQMGSLSLSTAHLLRPTAQSGSGWLTHSSGYSSNSSGPKMEMENAHVEIPTSKCLLQAPFPHDGSR